MTAPSAAIQIASGPSVPCTFQCMEGKRLVLETSQSVSTSTPVTVHYEDALFLGEVVTCTGSDEKWKVEIKVEQILTGLQNLMALRASLMSAGLMSEEVPQSAALARA